RARYRALQVLDNKGDLVWLGGRDSNPDTVVQRTVDGVSSAPVRAFSRGFLAITSGRLASVSLTFLCSVSHRVSPRELVPPSLQARLRPCLPTAAYRMSPVRSRYQQTLAR